MPPKNSIVSIQCIYKKESLRSMRGSLFITDYFWGLFAADL